jgi:dihydroflavonol-4-reductase
MKILITGITGLFGSYLAKTFKNLGEIHGLKRPDSDLSLLAGWEGDIHWHIGDVNDFQSLEEAFQGMDLIIHAAGMVSFSNQHERELLKVNVEGTENVVNVMLDLQIPQLIHVSSVAALGRSPESMLVNENQKWTASDLNSSYAISKYLGELEVWRGAQEGLKVMVVNPSVLLGKISDNRSSTAIYKYVLEERKFFPKGHLNYIDVRDAAAITLKLFQKGAWNERFILSRESKSYKEFFESAAEVLEKKAPGWPVPNKMIGLAGLWFKITRLFSSSPGDYSQQAVRAAQYPIVFENTKSTELTDFSYTPLEETLSWAKRNER